MDSAYRLFNIGLDGTSRRRESWERFKTRVARILFIAVVFIAVWRNVIIIYIFIFINVNKTNACMCYIVT